MSDPRPLYDPSDPRENPEGYKAYKAKKSKIAKRMNDGKAPLDVLSKRFAKHAKTFDSLKKFKHSDKPF